MLAESKFLFGVTNFINNLGILSLPIKEITMAVSAVDFLITAYKDWNEPSTAATVSTRKTIPIIQRVDLKATGSITNYTSDESFTSFVLPNTMQNGVTETYKPKYNKTLGVFNLLRTPVVEYVEYAGQGFHNQEDCYGLSMPALKEYRLKDIKYVLNPNSELEIIDIKGAILFEDAGSNYNYNEASISTSRCRPIGHGEEYIMYYHYSLKNKFGPFSFGRYRGLSITDKTEYNISNANANHFFKTLREQGYTVERAPKDINSTDKALYRTDYLPLQCLKNKSILLGGNNHKFLLKLIVAFKTPNDKTIIFTQTYNVKTKLKSSSILNYDYHCSDVLGTSFSYGTDYYFTTDESPWENNGINDFSASDLHIENQIITGNQTIKTTKSIYLKNVTIADNAFLHCIAGEKVDVDPSFESGNGTLTFEIMNSSEMCGEPILPVNEEDISLFCSSRDYPQNTNKSNILKNKPNKPLKTELEFSISPNPVSDKLTVNIKQGHKIEYVQYEIIDIFGKKIQKGKININSKIDVSNLSPSVYIIRLISSNNYSTLKFIKN